ncbi:hypothetical protein EYF80_041417 [Liparis tanakae]|uniref:Uncharacterized protein n=1 Tax=Liparis tanakae TaxID=230148 RepID=A0A4Z2G4C7_9TELE|nr:hypothetical protein EYF80_041417 [Liparis tanakae]
MVGRVSAVQQSDCDAHCVPLYRKAARDFGRGRQEGDAKCSTAQCRKISGFTPSLSFVYSNMRKEKELDTPSPFPAISTVASSGHLLRIRTTVVDSVTRASRFSSRSCVSNFSQTLWFSSTSVLPSTGTVKPASV